MLSAPAGDDRAPVPPGSGWPGDPATPRTPVAHTAAEVADLASEAGTLDELSARESVCRACPRLVAWREKVAIERRRQFADERYWGRPVPGWGDPEPRILIVGLAPAAHGGNRTGRIFTGDRSGDFLFASLFRCGLAAQPTSVAAGDGQRLIGTRVVAAVRCAPPENKPTPAERDTCAPWLTAELSQAMTPPSPAGPDRPGVPPPPAGPDRPPGTLRAIVCLGGFAWQALWPALAAAAIDGRYSDPPRPRPAFGHGVEVRMGGVLLIGCYHPSQQNTFTGRVTPGMLDAVFRRAAAA